jgi:hypothetical protein
VPDLQQLLAAKAVVIPPRPVGRLAAAAAVLNAEGLTHPAPPHREGPDPSRVYGYISLVDPVTHVEHLIHDSPGFPNDTNGYPQEWTVTFRSSDGTHETSVVMQNIMGEVTRNAVGNPERIDGVNNLGSFAWYYDIALNGDRTEGAPRYVHYLRTVTDVNSPNYYPPGATAVIAYNPDDWFFESISVDYMDYFPGGDTRQPEIRIPFAPCAEPFADLPNFEA